MLKIAVCDDSRELLEKVEKDLLEYESVRSTPVTIHTYTFVYGTLPGLALALLGSYAVMRECAEAKSPVRWWALAVFR